MYSGVDLSKMLGGQTKILGKKVVNSDKYMGVSQLLGHMPGLPPKVYAYGYVVSCCMDQTRTV